MIISILVICLIMKDTKQNIYFAAFLFSSKKKIEPYYMLYMGRHLSIKHLFFLSFLFSCKMATKLNLIQNCTLE